MRKLERLIALTRILTDRPGEILSLSSLSQRLGGARSTLSEDLSLIRKVMAEYGLGRVDTVSGARGGIVFIPTLTEEERHTFIQELCEELEQPHRILPGGFLYMADLLCSPVWAWKIGSIFADSFRDQEPEYVLTMETKGIPLATMTARALNCPLVIIRRSHKVTEGSAVSINYITGSSRTIGSMSLPRRALPEGARVVLIDDFMKAGGTARGMLDLMEEFQAQVLGLGVVVVTREPQIKLVDHFQALISLEKVDVDANAITALPSTL